MATLNSDILGKVLHYHELEPIVITHSADTPLRVRISTDDSGDILDDSYFSDFDGSIIIDIRDIVAHELAFTLPEELDETIRQDSLFKVFHISIGADQIKGDFTVNGFSKESAERMTDIDTLRVPQEYILPLCWPCISTGLGLSYLLPDGSELDGGNLGGSSAGIGTMTRMICLSASPAAGAKRFQARLVDNKHEFLTPVFEVVNGNFEQYLFANRYGGFDNIPMDGALSFLPEMSFEAGSYSGHNEPVSSESEYIYSQNSGYLSRKVMELASELLCSSQIYHLDKSGQWHRIVILESDLKTSSRDELHSFTFSYKHADDTRPMSLKGKTATTYAVRGGNDGGVPLVFALTQSPMKIEHGKGKTPCVTVVDTDNQEVEVCVTHTDTNNITISWNGDLSGYVYIN